MHRNMNYYHHPRGVEFRTDPLLSNRGRRVDVDPSGDGEWDIWLFNALDDKWGPYIRIECFQSGRRVHIWLADSLDPNRMPDSRQLFDMCSAVVEDGAPIEPLLDYLTDVWPELHPLIQSICQPPGCAPIPVTFDLPTDGSDRSPSDEPESC